MKRILLFLIALLLVLSGCTAPEASAGGYRQVSMQEAINLMASETDYVILDVRTPSEYQSGHIPGAINIANETIGTADFSRLPDKEQLILVYCRSGNRSRQASSKLAGMGYTNIVEFGGINAWPGEIITN